MPITKHDVAEAVRQWIHASNQRDIEYICATDAKGFGYGYRTRDARDIQATDPDEYRQFMRGFYERHSSIRTTIEKLETAVDGDVGLAWGVYVEEFQIAGRPPERARVRFSQAMRRDEAGWRFLLFHRDIQPFDESGRYPLSLTTLA